VCGGMMPHSPPGGKDKIMFNHGLFPGTVQSGFPGMVPEQKQVEIHQDSFTA
jgi:hypothetical protein